MLHNLLPQQKRKELRTEYALRVVNVFVFALFVAAFCGIVALFPAYVRLAGEVGELGQEKETREALTQNNKTNPTAVLRKSAHMLALLESKIHEEHLTDLVDTVFLVQPSGVEIVGVSYDRKATTLAIEGVAVNREDLVLYTRALEESEQFTSIASPIENFAKNTNLPFRLSATINVE